MEASMEKIWLHSYPSGIANTIDDIKYSSLTELYTEACHEFGSKTAFSCLGTSISFNQTLAYSTKFAAFLQQELALSQTDKIAIMLPNILQYPVVMFGAMQAGLTAININPLDKGASLEYELSNSEATTIVVLENFAAELDKILPQTKIKNIIITKIGDLFPFPKKIIYNLVAKNIKKAVPSHRLQHYHSFSKIISKDNSYKYQKPNTTADDLAYIQYSSGTTGAPKGIMLTHGNILSNIHQTKAWVASLAGSDDIIVTALPLYHIFSLTANCWLYFILGAKNILIPDPKNMRRFIADIKHTKFTTITGVNTLFNALLNQPDFAKIDFSSLKLCLGGGMPVHTDTAKKWQQLTNCNIIEAYGLTETSPATAINPINQKEFSGSIGIALPSTDISIRNSKNEEVKIGEHGQLCIKGPQVTKGYWKNETATKQALHDGWLYSGDIVYMDKQGYLYMVDRLKDLIIVSGFNVSAAEIENTILELPEIIEAAAVSVKNAKQGESVVVFVALAPSSKLTELNIINFCHGKMVSYKVPHHIVFQKSLPKSNLGKVLKKDLRAQIANKETQL
jgi:long-chain acyl-CoA synthetase